MGDRWRKAGAPGDVILVVDVGGGTTDFSLIAVVDRAATSSSSASRSATTSCSAATTWTSRSRTRSPRSSRARARKLDRWQLLALTHGAPQAKEALFGDPAPARARRGPRPRLVARWAARSRTELTREELVARARRRLLPARRAGDARPRARRARARQARPAVRQDPRSPATSPRSSRATGRRGARAAPVAARGEAFLHPTAVLFNGGVMKAAPLKAAAARGRSGWLAAEGRRPAACCPRRTSTSRSRAARPTYGRVRAGHGIRIRGGTARAYYVGVEAAMPAVPGLEPPVRALCVAPFGMEEGTEARTAGRGARPGGRRAGAVPLLRLDGAARGPGRRPSVEDETSSTSCRRSRRRCPPEGARRARWSRCGSAPTSPRSARSSSSAVEPRRQAGRLEWNLRQGAGGRRGARRPAPAARGCDEALAARATSSASTSARSTPRSPRWTSLRGVIPPRRRRAVPGPSSSRPARWRRGRCCRPARTRPAPELAPARLRCPGASGRSWSASSRASRGARAGPAGRVREELARRTRGSTAPRRSCRGARPRACRSSRRSRRPRSTSRTCATRGTRRTRTRRSRAGGRAHGAGVVRRGGARAHARGGARGGPPAADLLEEPQAAFYDWPRGTATLAAGARRPRAWCWWWTWAAARPTSR